VEPSALHSQLEDFDADDAFVYFVLGLISMSRQFIERLEAEAETSRPAAPPVQSEEPIARILI
jgi:hypothetical protein